VLAVGNTLVVAVVLQADLLGPAFRLPRAHILSAAFGVAVLVMLVLLPRLLTRINRLLAAIPRFGPTLARRLDAPFLYALLLVAWVPVLTLWRDVVPNLSGTA